METALLDMGQKTDLEILEENFAALQDEIRELNLSALQAMKSLDSKAGSTAFDVDRYKDRKQRLLDRVPLLQSKLLKERIHVAQQRREQTQRELDGLQPLQLETKARFIEAQKIVEEAWRQHALIDLKAASLESQLQIDFENLRADQRALQELISQVTGIVEEDMGQHGPDNRLIRN
jgi:hypothetical protein